MSEINNNKNKVDSLLSVIELNKQKLNILLKMEKEELENGNSSSCFLELLDIYTMICDATYKKIHRLDEIEKQKLVQVITELNEESKLLQNPLSQLLESSEKELILSRVISDLGIPLMKIYSNDSSPNFLQHLFSYLGLSLSSENSEENEIYTNRINEYMISDYSNTLLVSIEDLLSKIPNPKEKEELLHLKYRCIFLFESLEYRVLITKFSIPNYPHLVDEITVQTAGISMEEYLDNFDEILCPWLERIIKNNALDIIEKGHDLSLKARVYLQTLAALLTDKELCDSLKLSDSLFCQLESDDLVEKLYKINDILEQVKESSYQYQRKYPNI